jgi:hypothetical protein
VIPLLASVFACSTTPDEGGADSGAADGTSPGDSGEDSDDLPEFDESCFAQVMRSQLVCDCSLLEFDWSGLTHDSEGQPFTPADVRLVHWFILNMPASGVNTNLCSGGDAALRSFSNDNLRGNVLVGDGSHATIDVGNWTVETGVLALYDTTASDGAYLWPRAAAVFNFDADTSGKLVTVEGRGDVYTAP